MDTNVATWRCTHTLGHVLSTALKSGATLIVGPFQSELLLIVARQLNFHVKGFHGDVLAREHAEVAAWSCRSAVEQVPWSCGCTRRFCWVWGLSFISAS